MSTEFFERCPYICLRVWAWFAMFACIYFNILFEESKIFKQEVISVRSVQRFLRPLRPLSGASFQQIITKYKYETGRLVGSTVTASRGYLANKLKSPLTKERPKLQAIGLAGPAVARVDAGAL